MAELKHFWKSCYWFRLLFELVESLSKHLKAPKQSFFVWWSNWQGPGNLWKSFELKLFCQSQEDSFKSFWKQLENTETCKSFSQNTNFKLERKAFCEFRVKQSSKTLVTILKLLMLESFQSHEKSSRVTSPSSANLFFIKSATIWYFPKKALPTEKEYLRATLCVMSSRGSF